MTTLKNDNKRGNELSKLKDVNDVKEVTVANKLDDKAELQKQKSRTYVKQWYDKGGNEKMLNKYKSNDERIKKLVNRYKTDEVFIKALLKEFPKNKLLSLIIL